jgi:hypothetical protein
MHLSTFARYLNENAQHLRPATLRAIKSEARDRVTARLRAARADCELTFDDLFERCEREISPKHA